LTTQLWLLLFADDAIIFAPSLDMARQLFLHFATFCEAEGLTISAAKSKVMVFNDRASQY
jgi:hypothetical protein